MKHFSKQLDGDYKKRNAICRLLGVNPSTGREWFGKMDLPIGVYLLNLRCLLSTLGYVVSELETLSPNARVCAEALGFRVASLDLMASSLNRSHWTVHEILVRNGGTSKEVESKMELFAAGISDDLAQAKASWAKELGMEPNVVVPPAEQPVCKDKVEPVHEDEAKSPESQPGGHEQDLVLLSHMVLATLPIAKRVLSDEFSGEDRNRLRHLTRTPNHSHAVFELYQALGGLCSERARNNKLNNQQ
jgi:hypothetical protein